MDTWKNELQNAVLAEIEKLDNTRELKIFDVGLFPWHSSIELSAFYAGDEKEKDCYEDEVASWPNYNFSSNNEWASGKSMIQTMGEAYTKDAASKKMYFEAVASTMKSEAVQQSLSTKNLHPDFRITVFDPDDPDKNYM